MNMLKAIWAEVPANIRVAIYVGLGGVLVAGAVYLNSLS